MANERARGLGYKFVTDDKYLVNPFSPTDGISYEGDGSPVSYANSMGGIMTQAPIPGPLKYIPEGDGGGGKPPGPTGPDPGAVTADDYGYGAIGNDPSMNMTEEEQAGVDSINNAKMSKMDALKAAGAFAFMGPFAGIFSAYRSQKKAREEAVAAAKAAQQQRDFDAAKANQRTSNPSGKLGGPDGMSGGDYAGGAGFASANAYGGDGTTNDQGADTFAKDGGRIGYFFGGRVNYKAGGRTDAGPNRSTASHSTRGQINEAGQKVSGGDYNNNGGNNFSSTVDINKKIKEKINERLIGMIPDRVDKNQLLFNNAKRYQTLSKNRNSPYYNNRPDGPKTINKNLYTNNLTNLNLQYPDIKIKDEYGIIDADKAKSLIDQAVVEQTISPVEALNLTRSIDTTGTQSNTSGNYTLGNFDFSSPNIEKGVLNSKFNYDLGDLNLSAGVNTNDSTINDSKLGFNYEDGALIGSTYRDNDYGYTTNKLDVNKTFDVGNNFKVGLDGNYENTIYNGENYRDSEFTPSLNYDNGTFNARLSKEIVEGGTQPGLGVGFQKNGFYGSANNILSQKPTSVIGYKKNIGSPDGPLQFSAGGEMDPITGQSTAGLYLTMALGKKNGGRIGFKNGGLASIL